jgi:hypothetical protein
LTVARPIPIPISANEAAGLLGVSIRTLLTHRDEWHLTSKKLGKSWVFLTNEVLDLLDGGGSLVRSAQLR